MRAAAILMAIVGLYGFAWLLNRALERYERMRDQRQMFVDDDPDPTIHRPGSITDFQGQMQRSRWP